MKITALTAVGEKLKSAFGGIGQKARKLAFEA